jgi:sugar phosphate isomerase/epimerase
MNIGIDLRNIYEITNGVIYANEVDLIEVGGKDLIKGGKLDWELLNKLSSLDIHFSIHAPYSSPTNEDLLDLGIIREKNFKVMKAVFESASFLGTEWVVMHGDKINGNPRKSFLNLLFNLKTLSKLAKDYSITLLLENLHKEKGWDRFGILPQELLAIINLVREENLKITLDVGHAFLASNLYGIDLMSFFDYLSPYIYHMHLHDNLGIPAEINEEYGDQHLPLGKGKIDFNQIFDKIEQIQPKNLVLELKHVSRAEAIESINILKQLKDKQAKRISKVLES